MAYPELLQDIKIRIRGLIIVPQPVAQLDTQNHRCIRLRIDQGPA